jgi:mono/diheme cytochrome c family protein
MRTCIRTGIAAVRTAIVLVAVSLWPVAAAAQPEEDVELATRTPGLVAKLRSLEPGTVPVVRIDLKPSLALDEGSPHPRLPVRPFQVEWTGSILMNDEGPIRFSAQVAGEVVVDVGGVEVLKAAGDKQSPVSAPGERLTPEPGWQPFRVVFRSPAETLPARLRLYWEGPGFSREPLPAWVLGHVATDESFQEEYVDDREGLELRAHVARFGCNQCHPAAFPTWHDPPPGPSLAGVDKRMEFDWLMAFLADPATLRKSATMPAFFSRDRRGFVERWLVAEVLLKFPPPEAVLAPETPEGDHRLGRRLFVSIGCAACHEPPDQHAPGESPVKRTSLLDVPDRFTRKELAAFIREPGARYPDHRMPRIAVSEAEASHIAAYVLRLDSPFVCLIPLDPPPTDEEVAGLAAELGVAGRKAVGTALITRRRCAACHPGLESEPVAPVPLAADRLSSDKATCTLGMSGGAYAREAGHAASRVFEAASAERFPSPSHERRRQLGRAGCVICHPRDTDRTSPLEEIGALLGGAWLQTLPYQKTPRLTDPLEKYALDHLRTAVRDGVSGLRPADYTYRMPAYGDQTDELVRALAEQDGQWWDQPGQGGTVTANPTTGTEEGPRIVGFQGYSCVSCHVWDGKLLTEPDPGAAAPDLTRVHGRIRQSWFRRLLENPARVHPRTPMPQIFPKGRPALLTQVLDGDPDRQFESLWAYLSLGKNAPSPKAAPPLVIAAPLAGDSPMAAQIPLRLPTGPAIEALCVLTPQSDLLVYDLSHVRLVQAYVGAQLLRGVQGRLRTYTAAGTPVLGFSPDESWIELHTPDGSIPPTSVALQGYDRRPDGLRIRYKVQFDSLAVEVEETARVEAVAPLRAWVRRLQFRSVDAKGAVILKLQVPVSPPENSRSAREETLFSLSPSADRPLEVTLRHPLPASADPPPAEPVLFVDPGLPLGPFERPGYRAVAFPRPKTAQGDDRVMPGAVAVSPRTGEPYVASMKTGEVFILRGADDPESARFEDYTGGLFQEAYSMMAEDDSLFVLHRRNLTRIRDEDSDGRADRFDRVFKTPQAVADAYDYGYGLVRDADGRFLLSFAPYGDRTIPGAGGLARLMDGRLEEFAGGFRNPLGWCVDSQREVFFTDNQGEWVAANKLSHIEPGRYYGFPNNERPAQKDLPYTQPAVWVPYDWAHSINGATCDLTGGEFGPFAGQIFMAELMFGGGIIRAALERVNGRFQGACFPFWGSGLLGPVTLAFDPKGRLYVGSITEPGWMAQPDRGALFRIEFTGDTPFEMQAIQVRPKGFRLRFTQPCDRSTASPVESYSLEHYRYEYTSAYGSPEMDRLGVRVLEADVSDDGLSVDLTTESLIGGRVYRITAGGVRSQSGRPLVYPTGAYTLHQIPTKEAP